VLKKGLFERLGSGVLCAEDMGFIAWRSGWWWELLGLSCCAEVAPPICEPAGGAFAMASLAPQRLVGGRRRRTATAVRVVDVELHVFLKLFEKEGAFKAHLLDTAV
jgi:hypothetical protein